MARYYIFLICCALVTAPGVTGCSISNENFPGAEIQVATDAILELSESDYESAYDRLTDKAREKLTLDEFKRTWDESADSLGRFVEISSLQSYPTQISEEKAISILMKCRFESGEAYYLVEVSADNKLASFDRIEQEKSREIK